MLLIEEPLLYWQEIRRTSRCGHQNESVDWYDFSFQGIKRILLVFRPIIGWDILPVYTGKLQLCCEGKTKFRKKNTILILIVLHTVVKILTLTKNVCCFEQKCAELRFGVQHSWMESWIWPLIDRSLNFVFYRVTLHIRIIGMRRLILKD